MISLLASLESTAFSTWLRESTSLLAFPFVLILHTVGLGFVVGANVAVNLCVLGVVPAVPLRSLDRYFRVAWVGFAVNAASGVLLLIAYPAKALTNPVFYVKLLLIAAAVAMMPRIRRRIGESRPSPEAISTLKRLAVASLVCWATAIVAGRLLAYTYSMLMAS